MLTGNTVAGGIGEPFGSGSRCGDAILARDGVMAWDGATGLLLQDNVFHDAAGSGVFLDGSSALMVGNAYANNTMDLVVQQQSCEGLPEWYSEAPQSDFCPFYSYPTCYAEFFYTAMPAEPVDWEEDKAALRPHLLPVDPIASRVRTHLVIPAARFELPYSHHSLSR